jgi:hypothetical protein
MRTSFHFFRQALIVWLAFLTLAGRSQPVEKLTLTEGREMKKLELRGEAGHEYRIEGTADLNGKTSWEPLLQLIVPPTGFAWDDPTSASAPRRFYRVTKLPPFVERDAAGDFRLLDQSGKSRGLHYLADRRAVVLVVIDPGCATLDQSASVLKALRDRFTSQGVVFWWIATGSPASREELAARAAALGFDGPVLQDTAGLVVRNLGVRAALEVVAVDTADWTVFYRGAINDQTGGDVPPVRQYLSDALENFLAGKAVSPSRTTVAACPLPLADGVTPSYATDIAPLLQRSCVHCHSAGNIAPWEMKGYEAVKNYASLIKANVLTGAMPPWHADPAFGTFSNDASLKPDEARMLARWVADGAPRGDGPDPLADLFASQPPPADYPNTWPADLGKPDFIASIPRFTVPAGGLVDYQYITVPLKIPEEKWLKAAVVLPGNPKVVHHSLVFMGSLLDVLLSRGGLGGYFASYVPGMKAGAFPEGTAKRLPANASVTFQMHYTTVGTIEQDETRIGLYFADAPPKAELITTAAATVSIQIPPGVPEYEREASVVPSAGKDILLYEMSPHMHYRGLRFKFEAVFPNGTTETLLSVPKYDFHWQTLYRLAEPKRLPAGTRIRCTGAFDNSPQNPDNPNSKATVRFGEQTADEMFIGYLNYSEIP